MESDIQLKSLIVSLYWTSISPLLPEKDIPRFSRALSMSSLCEPPILWCWPTSEADVGGMAVETESSHQYSLTFCCCVTDGSKEAVWQNDIWSESAYEAKVSHWIPPCGKKNGPHWHSLTLAECWWRPNSGCEHSEMVGGAFQHWWQQITSTGADFYECGMQALVHRWWKCIARGGGYVEK